MNMEVKPLPRKFTRAEIRRLRKIWEKIPSVGCKGLCWRSCQNVPIWPAEAYYLIEKRQAAMVFAPHGYPHPDPNHTLPTLGDGKLCAFLTPEKRCSIYADRPFICRIFGHPVNRFMVCSYGCRSKTPIGEREFLQLVKELCQVLNDPLEVNREDGIDDVVMRQARKMMADSQGNP